jgi:hypothetical protein
MRRRSNIGQLAVVAIVVVAAADRDRLMKGDEDHPCRAT